MPGTSPTVDRLVRAARFEASWKRGQGISPSAARVALAHGHRGAARGLRPSRARPEPGFERIVIGRSDTARQAGAGGRCETEFPGEGPQQDRVVPNDLVERVLHELAAPGTAHERTRGLEGASCLDVADDGLAVRA